MKNKLSIVAFTLLLFSCSKVNDLQPISSEQSDDGRRRPGTATVTWKNKGSYPSFREIDYNQYRITPYEIWDGVKYTLFRTDPALAKQNDTLRYTNFSENFRVGYANQLDSAVDWKALRGFTAIIYKSTTTNRAISLREIEDSDGNVTKKESSTAVTVVNDSTKSKIGTAKGRDNIGGTITSWDYEITKPLIYIGKYKYAVSGTEKYTIGADVKVIDFGDGTKNNRATLSVNGGAPEPITLPYDGVPSTIDDGE